MASEAYSVPLIINGKTVTTESQFSVNDPKTGKELWKASGATATEANAAADAANAAFPIWSGLSYLQRKEHILKAADHLAANIDELKSFDMRETAAGEGWADFDCQTAVMILREVAARISAISGEIPVVTDTNVTALVYKVPYGVVLGIAPWNAAALLGVRAIAYALAAGNTVILKSSELSVRTHFALADAFLKTGCPPGVVNVIVHDRASGPKVMGALIRHPAVKKINFTGSTATGRILAEQAGRELKPILLELGGKAPVIVLADADLKAAAGAVAFGSNFHAGQVCMATERVIVVESVAAEFEKVLKETYEASNPSGTEHQESVTMAGAEKVKDLVDDAVKNGAEFIAGSPGYGDGEGRSIQPTILKNVEKSKLYYTESFGPVVSFIVVPDTEEAIKVANDTEYGLSAAVFGGLENALKVAKRIESGAVHINEATIHDEPTLPHGAFKSSGNGRFGGAWGIAEFLTTKTIRFRV